MTKTHECIKINGGYVVTDKKAPCPKGTWAIFPNTCNGEIKDFEGCEPILCKSDYAINGVYNLHIIASIGIKIEGVPLIEEVDEVEKAKELFWKEFPVPKSHWPSGQKFDYDSGKKGFIRGYTIANTKQYSEKELKWAFMRGALINQRSHKGEKLTFTEERDKDIKSLQKAPISIELEYEEISDEIDRIYADGDYSIKLKVNPDNTITPIKINFL